MARITVRSIGRRNADVPHCAICGSKRSAGHGTCINFCHWLLPNWIGFNAVLRETVFLDSRALPLAKLHRWNSETKRIHAPSFPKLVAAARAMGWDGDTGAMSQPVFVEAA